MKKTIIISSAVLISLVILVLLLPYFFRGTLLEKTKATLNRNLQAKIDFSDFRVSLLRDFPLMTMELKNVVITGKNGFENDTLISIPVLRSSIHLFSIFTSGEKTIEELKADRAVLNLLTDKEGKVNWDIFPVEGNTATATAGNNSGFGLKLNSIGINDASVVYNDCSTGLNLGFKHVDLSISGKMYGSTAELKAAGDAGEFTVVFDSVTYISKTKLKTRSLLKIDYEKTNVSIIENELFVNSLPLEVLGDIQMPDDSIWFDLKFKTKTSDFKNFLELIPPDYTNYLAGLSTTGSAAMDGKINGGYTDSGYPLIDIGLKISDGRVKYNKLPEEIRNINAEVYLKKPQGDFDKMVIQVKKAHVEVQNNPVDLTLLITNPLSDLLFDGAFVGKVNFDNLKNALPIDSLNIAGEIDANLFVKGNYSSIEKELYDKVLVEGIARLGNFVYTDPELTQMIRIPSGKLDFSPSSVNLKELNMNIGQSDFSLTGSVSDYLSYLFRQGTLHGTLDLNSRFVNFNELMGLQRSSKPAKDSANASGTVVRPFDVPERIDFTFRSEISKALFENLSVTDISGLIRVNAGTLNLEGLKMMMLDGEMKLAGSYRNTPENKPLIDFGFNILNFDIPLAFRSLTSVQRMFPVAGNAMGKLSTDFRMQGQFSPEMKLVSSTVDGLGSFLTNNIHIVESPVFDQLKGILKAEKLKDVKIDDFTAKFTIQDGNLLLKPFKTSIADQETTIYGSLDPQNLLDMKMDFIIDRNAFGTDIQSLLSILPGQEKITRIPATVLISGPVGKPSVKLDLSQARQNIASEVKKSTREDLQKTINKLGDGLKKLFK